MIEPEEISLVLGLDAAHLSELRLTWPTWMRFKPELLRMPAIVFYDAAQIQPEQAEFLREHPQLRWVPWEMPLARNQREKMLSGFVHVPALEVTTPWYLKLDTDAVATDARVWLRKEWFETDERGRLPVFIAPRWGYTKPRYAINVLDDWADDIPKLAAHQRLNVAYSSVSRKARHHRIISWFFLGQTAWTRQIIPWLDPGGRLPLPSQDTLLSYCAARLGEHYVRLSPHRLGWEHWRTRRIAQSFGGTKTNTEIPRVDMFAPQSPARSLVSARGAIYYHTGTSCAVRLLVSLWSLRKHYSGPVTILSHGPDSHSYTHRIAAALGAEVREWEPAIPKGPNSILLAKTRYHEATPYEVTVVLDTDTVALGPIDELFDYAAESSFVIAQMADWTTSKRRIVSRIESWRPWLGEWIDAALNFGPAVNCGVLSFRRDAPIWADWYRLSLLGRENFIPDETSCQVLLHRYPHRVVDSRWNRSCVYDDPERADTRIVHFHGRRHCRPELPNNGGLWVSLFDEVMARDVAGVRMWLPAGDRTLKRFLRWRQTLVRNSVLSERN